MLLLIVGNQGFSRWEGNFSCGISEIIAKSIPMTDFEGQSDEDLAEKLKSLKGEGDSKAAGEIWLELSVRKRGLVHYLITNLTIRLGAKETIDANELTETVLSEIYRSIENYNNRFLFNTWIGAISRYTTLSEWRIRRREISVAELPHSLGSATGEIEDPGEKADARNLLRLLRQHFFDMGKHQYYEVLFYRNQMGMNFRKIAFALQLVSDSSEERAIRNAAERVRTWFNEAERIVQEFRNIHNL